MRINKFIAFASQLSRRAADQAIADGRVLINGQPPVTGQTVTASDVVTLDEQTLTPRQTHTTISLHKPAGYVCSRDGQGSQTIYDLLPSELHHLNPVGRLDKDSSGLLLMTDDGDLANQLTHPKYVKDKLYEVSLDKPLTQEDVAAINNGVTLEDGISNLKLKAHGSDWQVVMHEGRNRQIRRTFAARGYTVVKLHRTKFGLTELTTLQPGKYRTESLLGD